MAIGTGKAKVRLKQVSWSVLALASSMTITPDVAFAQSAAASEEARIAFDIPAQSLGDALRQFAERTGIQLGYSTELVAGRQSAAVRGSMTAREALKQLLAGTGITARFIDARTVSLELIPAVDGARVLGAVRVEGAQSGGMFPSADGFGAGTGANGSSDPVATEGTGSLTTNGSNIASKAPLSLKDTPQSVTVLTSERLDQQNLTDLTSAMAYAPGITTEIRNSSISPSFISRGFAINTFRIDGGAPMDLGLRSNYRSTPDLATFDRVEILRGSDGLFGGAGSPGGVVNLARKRPLDHGQLIAEGQLGSWNNYRFEFDASAPIALDGHLRGRVVTVYQDRNFFYDVAHQNKTLMYGVVEGDLSPKTIVRIGASHEKREDVPNFAGLPRFSDGSDLKLPRSTCLCAPWANWDFSTDEIFASVEHQFSPRWSLKINATQLKQFSETKEGSAFGLIDPATGNGSAFSGAAYSEFFVRQRAIDAVINGKIEAFGLEQDLLVGIDYSTSKSTLLNGYGGSVFVPIDVFDFDPRVTGPEPATPPFSLAQPNLWQEQWGGFASLTLRPLRRLSLGGGFRISSYKFRNEVSFLDPATGQSLFDSVSFYRDDGHFTPYLSAKYDITDDWNIYASYSDIYQSQANQLSADGSPLPPQTGVTYELGAKGSLANGRLNISAALFRSVESNRAVRDRNAPPSSGPGGSACCYAAIGEARNTGFDAEISGEIAVGWQIQAGYTYIEGKVNEALGGGEIYSQQPRHQLKIWSTYLPNDRMSISGGFRLESDRYTSGSVCPEPIDPDIGFCQVDEIPFEFTQNTYAVMDARLSYKLTTNLELAVNLNNLTDTRYYATAGTSTYGNFYGEPRSATLSLRGKW